MNIRLTIRKIGDSLLIILGIRPTPHDLDFAEAIETGRDYIRRHRNALRQLAC